jgi:hypothetical protein
MDRADALVRWSLTFNEENRLPMLVVPGTREARLDVYRVLLERFEVVPRENAIIDLQAFSWRNEGVLENVTRRIASARVGTRSTLPVWYPPERNVWELFWSLVAVEDLTIQEPLRTLVDNAGFLAHHLYRLLWEARFLAKENVNLKPAQTFVELITRWVAGSTLSEDETVRLAKLGVKQKVETLSQHFDLLCMIVTLAEHNGFVSEMVLSFDALEEALEHENRTQLLRGLSRFLDSIERWIKEGGSPIGVLIGFNATPASMARLREHHPRLADHVRKGLTWTEE